MQDRVNFWKRNGERFMEQMRYMAKWTLFSMMIGILVGFVGGSFSYLIDRATGFWTMNAYALFLLPFLGIFIRGFYHLLGVQKPKGTNLVIASLASGEEITIKMAPLIYFSTILTHLGGGSSGREGAALQIGGSLGNLLAKLVRFDSKDKSIAVMCGMSACFSAVFATPLAATVFAMEVSSIGIMQYSALIPCFFSAVVAIAVAGRMGVHPETFSISDIPVLNMPVMLWIALLGICCAVISVCFCIMLHKSHEGFIHYIKNPYFRNVIGALIFIGLTLLIGSDDYRGGGFALIEKAMEGDVRMEAFFMKMLFTAILLGAGFKGGEIVPSFTVGGTFGAAFALLFGLPVQLCTACGMVACFAGMTNCPLASIFIAIELFGANGILFYVLAIAISFTLSGYHGLYHAQRFPYSKLRTEYINKTSEE